MLAGIAEGGGDVFGFEHAERDIGFGGAARAAEIHEQDGDSHGVELPGFEEEAGFLGGVAGEENDERGGGVVRGVPTGQSDGGGGGDGEGLGLWSENRGWAFIDGAGQVNAGKKDAEFGEAGKVFGFLGAGASGRGIVQHGIGVAPGENVQHEEASKKQNTQNF